MPVRIGIAGCGAISGTHAQAIARIEDAEVSGFFDVVESRSQTAADRFGAPAFPSFEELCEASDAISVCVPSGLHGEVGLAAVRLGKHLLVEKPIEVTMSAALRLVEGAEAANVKLSVISQHRFAPEIRRLRSAVLEGQLGDLIEGDAYIKWYRTQRYYDSGEWRGTWRLDGGGCLINQGIHYIDMIQWILGGVSSVQAQVKTSAHQIEVEDIAAALLEYKNGALGVIQGSTSFFPGFRERLEVHGTAGSVIIEGDEAAVWEIDEDRETDTSLYGRGVQAQPTPNLAASERSTRQSSVDPSERWIEQHKLQIQDFVESIRNDREPYITGRMALEPLKLILAIYKSAKEGGRRVSIEEVTL